MIRYRVREQRGTNTYGINFKNQKERDQSFFWDRCSFFRSFIIPAEMKESGKKDNWEPLQKSIQI